jgi:hypothetical protein
LFGLGVTGNLAGTVFTVTDADTYRVSLDLPTDVTSTGGAQVFVNGAPVVPVFTSTPGTPIVGTVTTPVPAAGTIEIRAVGGTLELLPVSTLLIETLL